MNPPPSARPVMPPIAIDLPCLGCRYNLRTLPVDAVCPECATPVRRTLDHGWLVFADPDWLQRLRSGFLFLLLTLVVAVIGFAAIIGYVIFKVVPSGEPDELVLGALTGATGLAYAILWLLGIWRLTAPEPASPSHRPPSKLNYWIRLLNISAILIFVAFALVGSGLNEDIASNHILAITGITIYALGWAAFAVGFLILLAQLRRLARRATKPALGQLMTFMLWGGIVLTVLAGASAAVAAGWLRAAANASNILVTTNPAFPPVATTMNVRVLPTGVSMNWSAPPTTTTASGPAPASAPTATTAPAVGAMPFPAGAKLGIVGILISECAITLWGAGWLLTLISFRRVLKQAIHENASAAYAGWLTAQQI